MKYGIIGTGWIAESFIEGVRLKTGSEISAVYSRSEQRGEAFALKNGVRRSFTDIEEFLSGDIDAVYIASPNICHFEQSRLALEAGKHVICEKPVTVTPEEYITCKRLADEKHLIYLEAIMYMHTPSREILREALPRIGRITSAHFDFSQLSSKYPAYLRGENPNIFNPAMATGGLMDLGIYCVYPAVDLFGIPSKITADAVFLDSGADCSGVFSFNYGDKLVTSTYSKTGQDHSGSDIYGDNGSIHIESISKLINASVTDNEGNTYPLLPDIPKGEIMGFEAAEFEEFIRCPESEKYALSCKRSLEVSKIMREIRSLANIHFPGEKRNA